LDETESRIIEHRLREEGVRIHYHTEVEEIIGRRGRVVGLRTKGGKQIKCEIVAFAIGIRPRLQLAKSTGLTTDRGILVNEYLETNLPDIYAAGDVAQVFDPLTGQMVVDSLWNPARHQGHIAGLNMSGQRIPYLKSVPFNVTRLAGLTTTIIGLVGSNNNKEVFDIVRGESETWQQIPDAIACQSNFEVNRLRILVGERTLMGAVVMGNQTLSQPLQKMISGKADITEIRDQLLQSDPPMVEIISDFWSVWRHQLAS
jgi:NAD(P)H-nitrite reductase large subunit